MESTTTPDATTERLVERLATDPDLTVNGLVGAAAKHGIDPLMVLERVAAWTTRGA